MMNARPASRVKNRQAFFAPCCLGPHRLKFGGRRKNAPCRIRQRAKYRGTTSIYRPFTGYGLRGFVKGKPQRDNGRTRHIPTGFSSFRRLLQDVFTLYGSPSFSKTRALCAASRQGYFFPSSQSMYETGLIIVQARFFVKSSFFGKPQPRPAAPEHRREWPRICVHRL